ncbi:MAG: HNH endonuclease [Spirochaetes bacterium]|nr:HNH endonuclease [Spirochaetota bacterium]
MMPVNVEEEKQKARKLRSSSWWKRKMGDGHCYYCREQFKPSELTMDHLIPLARGGRSEKNNLVPCCKECNSKKKYMMPFEWDEYLQLISEK